MAAPDEHAPPPVDPQLLDELEQEAPVLMTLRRFAEGLDDVSWFAHLGEPPTAKVRDAALAFTDALGFPDADLAIAPTWEDAAAAGETYDWSSPSWETEELTRADLTARALDVLSEDALAVGLQLVAQHAGESAKASMEEEASYWDMEEEGARQLAVGALAQAAHTTALLLVAASADPELSPETHHVALKFRLFELGRWPVAIVGSSFTLF